METEKCLICGAAITPDFKFCPHCGFKHKTGMTRNDIRLCDYCIHYVPTNGKDDGELCRLQYGWAPTVKAVGEPCDNFKHY